MAMQGFPPFMVEMKITDDDDKDLPWDGTTFGRLKVRGPAVSGAYYRVKDNVLDDNGFFDTGDVATIDKSRLPADHRPLQGRDQVRRRMDFVDRSGEPRGRPPEGGGSRGDRRASSEMGRAAAADRAAQAGPDRHARGNPEVHGRQDRQVVDARRRAVRRRHSAHRHRQDPEDRAARPSSRTTASRPRRHKAQQLRRAMPASPRAIFGADAALGTAGIFALYSP